MIFHVYIRGLKKGVRPLYLVTLYHTTGPYILHMLYKNLFCWKQVKFYILSGKLLVRESRFCNVNCLQSFDFTFFYLHIRDADRGAHGRPQKFFQGGQRRHFTYHFQVVDDATQMDVHSARFRWWGAQAWWEAPCEDRI